MLSINYFYEDLGYDICLFSLLDFFIGFLSLFSFDQIYWLTPFVPLWWGLPPNITLAVALARALTLKVSESHLIGLLGVNP